MEKTITIVVPIIAKPESREKVKARLLAVGSQTRRESGNVFYRIHQGVSDPDRFIVYERWADQAALDHHMAQKYLQDFLDDSTPWLQTPIAGTICHELTD